MKPLMSLCRMMDLPKIQEARGNLTFLEHNSHVPFEMKRVYYLYDVPGGAERGAHAHKDLRQFIISLSGSFDVRLDDGLTRRTFHLNRPYQALYICPMVWRDLANFSSGSVCLVLASNKYSEDDYLRDYNEYIHARYASLYFQGE